MVRIAVLTGIGVLGTPAGDVRQREERYDRQPAEREKLILESRKVRTR